MLRDIEGLTREMADIDLVWLALTPSRILNKKSNTERESIETVGDSFLGFIVALWLRMNGVLDAKLITYIRSRVVNNTNKKTSSQSLEKIGNRIGIRKHLTQELKLEGIKPLKNQSLVPAKDVADTVEMLIGALIQSEKDGLLADGTTEGWINKIFGQDIEHAWADEIANPNQEGRSEKEPKSRLNGYCSKNNIDAPVYVRNHIRTNHDGHKVYVVDCVWQGGSNIVTFDEDTTEKVAEQKAAQRLIDILNKEEGANIH